MPNLEKLARALELANPFCLGTHFDGGLNHCFEASMSGALALRSFGVTAEAVPCVLIADNEARSITLTIGLGLRDMYDRLDRSEGALAPYEIWAKLHPMSRMPEDEQRRPHAVIVARSAEQHAIIDLTVGQIRSHGFDAPIQQSCVSGQAGWFGFDCADGTTVMYEDHLGPSFDMSRAEYRALAGDYQNLMELALSCQLNVDQFWAAIEAADPQQYAACFARFGKWSNLPAVR